MMQTIQLLAKPPWLRKPPYGWFYKSIYIYVFSNMCASCLTESKCGRVKMKTQIYLAAINNRVQLVYIMVYHGLSLVDCFNKHVPFWIPHMERRLQWQPWEESIRPGLPNKVAVPTETRMGQLGVPRKNKHMLNTTERHTWYHCWIRCW